MVEPVLCVSARAPLLQATTDAVAPRQSSLLSSVVDTRMVKWALVAFTVLVLLGAAATWVWTRQHFPVLRDEEDSPDR